MCVCAQQYSSCACISVTSTFVLFCWYAVLVRPNWVKTSNNDLFTVSASTVRWTCVTYILSWVVLLLWVCGKVGSSLVGLVLWHWGMAAGITDLNSDLWHNKERYDDWRVQPHHEMPQLLLLLPVHGDCFWLWLLMDTFMKLQFHLTPLEYTFPAKNGPLHLRIICCEANESKSLQLSRFRWLLNISTLKKMRSDVCKSKTVGSHTSISSSLPWLYLTEPSKMGEWWCGAVWSILRYYWGCAGTAITKVREWWCSRKWLWIRTVELKARWCRVSLRW